MKKLLFVFAFVMSVLTTSATSVYDGAIVDVARYDLSGEFVYDSSFTDCHLYGFPTNLPFVAVPSMSSGDIHRFTISEDLFREYCYKPNTDHYDSPVLMEQNGQVYSCYIRIMY